jgi:hypothetical protein
MNKLARLGPIFFGLAAACGSNGSDSNTHRIPSLAGVFVGSCTVVVDVPASKGGTTCKDEYGYDAAMIESTCLATHLASGTGSLTGTYSVDHCSTENLLGICTPPESEQKGEVEYIYSVGTGIAPKSAYKASCETATGYTWIDW